MAKPRAKKVIKIVLVVLAVIIVVVLVGGYIFYRDLTRGPLPKHNGELQVAGLYDRVEILRDEWGVPQIYASNMHDLFFAQGYTQAQDRWWQMDFYRYMTYGRVEEIAGKDNDMLELDVFFRTLGFRQLAERDVELLDPESRAGLQAFADGVNAYVMSRNPGDLDLTYGLLRLIGLGAKVEPWTPADTLALIRMQIYFNSAARSTENVRAQLYEVLGQEMTDQWLMPPWPFGKKPTIIQPEDLGAAGSTVAANYSVGSDAGIVDGHTLASRYAVPDVTPILGGTSAGCNGWVVSGNMTASGNALLADDLHMPDTEIPSLYYLIGLHCKPEDDQEPFDVVGITESIAPTVFYGHNPFIAWGQTTTWADAYDFYRIRVNPNNPFQYEWNGNWRDMTIRQETIRFAGSGETTDIQVRETHLGPIINDNKPDEETGETTGFNNKDPMALCWIGFEPSEIGQAGLALGRAKNWEEFRAAMQYWDVSSQGFVYADVYGNIGYLVSGRVPIRAENHSGLLPVPGWTDEFEWQGLVPYEDMPSVFNPKQGYIVMANNAVVPPEYYDKLAKELGEGRNYVFFNQWESYGYRAQRIAELLRDYAPHSIETFQQIQGDNKLISAEELMPYLANLQIDDAELAGTRDWLLTWDCQFDVDSPQAALYAEFWASLLDNLFNDELSMEQVHDSTMPSEVQQGIQSRGTDQDMLVVYLLVQQPSNVWWDDVTTEDVVEMRDDILLRSFQEGYVNTVSDLGKNRAKWEWGGLHTITFVHLPLGESGVSFVESRVNRGPYPVSGSDGTINATGWCLPSGEDPEKSRDFTVSLHPGVRMIIDLGNLSQSVNIVVPGQSGHPYSNNYSDAVRPWLRMEQHPMLWTREQVEASAVERLILKPSE